MTSPRPKTPIALTMAGSDPSGGAGIQADLKTFTALGVYGTTVITALTAQNTLGVTAVEPVAPAFIALEAETLLADVEVTAAKTGMLGDTATVVTVAGLLRRFEFGPIVVDPVMVATSGDVLLAPDAISAVRNLLLPLATLITPNLHEAARLLDEPLANGVEEMERQARELVARGARAALVKGGHASGEMAVDVLVTATGISHHAAPRIETQNTHGTGCTLSAAITAELAKGETQLDAAVARAKDYLSQALDAGRTLRVGRGKGPVDHLHALRR
ncbi:MAG: bifunctional hydroxymethylpyrimidine kinase/phosphomethylpyrimidine kinase [Hyphomicrobium sp.]|nr:bifunctional hydroxymethylpyrimidine kinase/phosphomethylpyrimidine kinase [Hyphomicrobium sp.]